MTFEEYLAELDSMCGKSYTTSGHDPYGTECDKPKGHPEREHEGPHPLSEHERLRWVGGGMCAGDPLPVTVLSG